MTIYRGKGGVAKQLTSGNEEAPLNKWLRFNREQKIVYEHKLSVTDYQ